MAIQHDYVGAASARAAAVAARLIVALLAVLVTVGLLLAPPAAAHSELTSSTPASGATLLAPPAEVSLVFNEEIAQTGLQVVAQGPAGAVPLGTPGVTGNTVAAPWPQDAGGGDFRVSYRVVSADGHPIDGTIAFAVSGAPAASPGGASGVATAVPLVEPEAMTPTSGDGAPTSGFPLWIPAVVVVVGVVIGAAIARSLRSRRSAAPGSAASGRLRHLPPDPR